MAGPFWLGQDQSAHNCRDSLLPQTRLTKREYQIHIRGAENQKGSKKMAKAVYKTLFMILHACMFLVASAATSEIDTSFPVTQDTQSMRHLTIPIRTSYVNIYFDPNLPTPMAVVAYDQADIPKSDLLFMNTEVLPVVARLTGCQIFMDRVPDTQLLPARQLNGIPLVC